MRPLTAPDRCVKKRPNPRCGRRPLSINPVRKARPASRPAPAAATRGLAGHRGGARAAARARPAPPSPHPPSEPAHTAARRPGRVPVGRARSDARWARRRARSSSWGRLMPGQHAAMNAATAGGRVSGAQPAGSARATSSRRSAMRGRRNSSLPDPGGKPPVPQRRSEPVAGAPVAAPCSVAASARCAVPRRRKPRFPDVCEHS